MTCPIRSVGGMDAGTILLARRHGCSQRSGAIIGGPKTPALSEGLVACERKAYIRWNGESARDVPLELSIGTPPPDPGCS
jgi:hypothetical protein